MVALLHADAPCSLLGLPAAFAAHQTTIIWSACRAISTRVAADVIKMADQEGRVTNPSAKRELRKGDAALLDWVASKMYKPTYDSLIHLPVGILE